MANFWLVQRLEEAHKGRHDNPFQDDDNVASTLNAQFNLDYMGAAEFEYGAVPKSGNRIAKTARHLRIVTHQIVTPNFEESVHFICTSEQEEGLLPEWHEWAKNPQTKENTFYFNSRDGWPYTGEYARNYVGWWALNEDIIWTREESRAESIRQAFVDLAATHQS